MSESVEKNIQRMEAMFRGDRDFVVREFELPDGTKAAVIFIDGLVNAKVISEHVIKPLMRGRPVNVSETGSAFSDEEAAKAMLSGDTVVFIDGIGSAEYYNTKGFPTRQVSEPETETVIRGPREGFTESLQMNTALVRRKLKTTHLRMELIQIGERSKTAMCLCWLDDVANPELIDEVRRRLELIDVDGVLSSGYIEEYIEDAPYSVFQTIGSTEKPDVVAGKLLEGRCALLVDGTPFALTMPMLFVENFHSPEDYAIRPYFATFLRLIRFAAFFVSLALPAFYVALVNFHQELIPAPLLYTIASASEGTPFSLTVETAVMLLTFEILREAGVRLPRPAGQAVSIVGALVMGQAAIEAGVVGAPVVIVIALSAMSGFVSPTASNAVAVLRWLLLLAASLTGGFGLVMTLLCVYLHLTSLTSIGAPYLHPIAPLSPRELGDTIVRIPVEMMINRPSPFHTLDKRRKAPYNRATFTEGLPNEGSEP
ncbi:MAG: spore germination protein [Oscillospiraceae bacterium]|jgi:spore germination protein KA|nr:spore germination protein [Oscillospiraceae bacterium]